MPAYTLTRKDIITQLQRYGIEHIPEEAEDEQLLASLDFIESMACNHSGLFPHLIEAVNHIWGGDKTC